MCQLQIAPLESYVDDLDKNVPVEQPLAPRRLKIGEGFHGEKVSICKISQCFSISQYTPNQPPLVTN